MQPDGLIAVASKGTAERVVEQLVAAVQARGMTVFARVDHGANARAAGLELRPTVLVVFGDARVGTSLIEAARTIAIDLPHRVLVWADERDQVWVAYNDPAWLARRHGLVVDARIVAMATMLEAVCGEAASGAG